MDNPIKQVPRHRNLYRAQSGKYSGKYFRLRAHGITPNNCWLIAPEFIELKDIDLAKGMDIYGTETIQLETGMVQAGPEYIKIN